MFAPMLRGAINWRVFFALAIFFAIMVFVVKPFADWGVDKWGWWQFPAVIVPVVLLIAWLIDRRARQKVRLEHSPDTRLSADD